MNFSHTQDQIDLRDAARDYLRGRCTKESLRELVENDQTSLSIWPELAELGLLGYLAHEDQGGLSMSIDGFALLAEEAGSVALPEPLLEVAGVSVPLLSAIGDSQASQLVEAIGQGTKRVLVSHALNPHVNHLAEDDEVLVFADNALYLQPAAQCVRTAIDSIDPLRDIYHLELPENIGAPLVLGDSIEGLDRVARLHGALLTAAELLGLSAGMIDMANEYAKERKQFGNPIGSYQAVKHHLANAFVSLEFARPVVYRASAALAAGDDAAELAVAHAKVAAIDTATKAAETAIQIHGGMGYTFEVDLHLWMKRVWALSGLWGDRSYQMQLIDKALFDENLSIGPASSFS